MILRPPGIVRESCVTHRTQVGDRSQTVFRQFSPTIPEFRLRIVQESSLRRCGLVFAKSAKIANSGGRQRFVAGSIQTAGETSGRLNSRGVRL